MNAFRLLPYVVVAVTAGAGGYFAGHYYGEKPLSSGRLKPAATGTPGGQGPALIPASIARIVGDAPLTEINANGITYRALEETDPVNRMASVGFLLESMTPANAEAIYQAFLDITKKTGRRHDGEWALMLKRYGEVVGETCFKKLLPEPQNLAFAIEGWASVDPDGVIKALKGSNVRDSRFDTALLTGICRTDPQKALSLALTSGYSTLDSAALITQAIHTSGLKGAQDAIQRAIDSPGAENASSGPIFQGLFGALVDTMMHKNTTDGTPELTLKWLEEQKGQPYVTATLDRVARESLLTGDSNQVISWILRMNEGQQGEAVGGKGIFSAVFEKPDILARMTDADFNRVLPMLPKSAPESFRSLAVMIESINPARAEQLRAAAPPEPETASEPPNGAAR